MTPPVSKAMFDAALHAKQAPHERQRAPAMRVAGMLIVLLALMATLPIRETLPRYFLYHQDLPVIALTLLVFAVCAAIPAGHRATNRILKLPAGAIVAGLAMLLILACLAGHYLILWGYAFSRDEQMALFDADIFARGDIIARMPREWASMQAALNTLFMPSGLNGVGWVSLYGPVNAAFHAGAMRVAGAEWTNPLLVAAGLIATWRVACRLLPDDRESQLVAILFYATSTQVLALGMTSYAMTAHLALNMIWLALFLHDRWYSHLAAIVVGFLAIGLHQIAYHPMFAGPVLFFGLVVQRRWAWSAIYALAYAFGIWLWARYAIYPLGELGLLPAPSEGDGFFLTRLMWALQEISPAYLWTQAANLVRFIAWQNLLLVPLFLLGAREALRRRDPRLIALLATIVVLVVFKLVLRPYQGHGWGYRYMHGAVGVACILAAVGWQELRRRAGIGWRHLLLATGATLFVAAPWLLWQAHSFSGLFAMPDRVIAASTANVVIVEDKGAEFAQDLVYNPPYLDRRPIRLLASKLSAEQMVTLCRGHSVAFVDAQALAPIEHAFGRRGNPSTDVPRLEAVARAAHCRIEPLKM